MRVTAAASELLTSGITALVLLVVSAAIVFAGVCGATWLQRGAAADDAASPDPRPSRGGADHRRGSTVIPTGTRAGGFEPLPENLGTSPVDDEVRRIDALALAAHARRTFTRAEQAAVAADDARKRRDALEKRGRTAWDAYDAASSRYEEARIRVSADEQTATLAIPEGEARQAVSHAAFTAYRRGDLSTAEFQALWRQVGGHDPQREGTDREMEALALEARRAHYAYKDIAAALRSAIDEVHVAAVAERACLDEAVVAAREAQEAVASVTARRGRRG